MSTLTRLGNNMLYGTARTTGRAGAVGAVGYAGYNWLENRVGSNGAKLLLGASGLAIAYAAFSGIKSAVSNTASLVKKAAIAAVVGVGGYALYQYFNRASNTVTPTATVQALDVDSAVDARQLTATIQNKFSNTANPNLAPDVMSDAPTSMGTPNVSNATPDMPNTTIDSPVERTTVAGLDTPLDSTNPVDIDTTSRPFSEAVETATDVHLNSALTHIADAGDEAAQIARAEQMAARFSGTSAEILTELKSILATAKASRLGANAPVVGMGIGLAAGAATTYVFGLQREYIEALHQENPQLVSETAKDAYLEMSYENQAILSGDVALSTLDPTGLSVLVTLGAENGTYHSFQEWMDTYNPTLPDDMAQGLSMSLFTPDTVNNEMAKQARRHLPDEISDQHPAVLNDAIKAGQEFDETMRSLLRFPVTQFDFDPNIQTVIAINSSVPELEEMRLAAVADGRIESATALEEFISLKTDVNIANENLLGELSNLTTSREGMSAYLNLIPVRDRMDIALRLGDSDPNSFEGHDMVGEYYTRYNDSYLLNAASYASNLRRNPERLNNYIMDRYGIGKNTPSHEPSSPQQEQFVAASNPAQPDPSQGSAPAMDNRMAAFRPDI